MPATISTLRQPQTGQKHPYTIALVANPTLEQVGDDGLLGLSRDPILDMAAEFHRAADHVHRALFGDLQGQRERLLSEAELDGLIRVLSIHEPDAAVSLATRLVAADPASHLLLGRRPAARAYLLSRGIDADVVFAISGSATHQSASAFCTTDDATSAFEEFDYDQTLLRHHHGTRLPGVVALHWSTSSVEPLHEFGHAASCYPHGVVTDLYDDEAVGLNKKRGVAGQPRPKDFGVYEDQSLATDPHRGSLEYPAHWLSYHCELLNPGSPSLMDSYPLGALGGLECEHDRLTRRFLLDRIRVKCGRP